MLLRPDGDDLIAIGQASHAWLSGQLARAWGNARFPPPDPREEVCLAAEQHDVGMALWDLTPALDRQTGLPVGFMQMTRAEHVALWRAAPERLLTQSRYAALLVSLHGTGLYERHVDVEGLPAEERAVVRGYLHDQHALQSRLARQTGAGADELERNRMLVAAWDALSLALCLRWAPYTCRDVPGADGPEDLGLAGDDERGEFTLRPWPLGAGEVVLRCEGRRLRSRCADAAELARALDDAPSVMLEFTLRRGFRTG